MSKSEEKGVRGGRVRGWEGEGRGERGKRSLRLKKVTQSLRDLGIMVRFIILNVSASIRMIMKMYFDFFLFFLKGLDFRAI